MSTGMILGGVVGAVIGGIIGGAPGALVGFNIGFGAGALIDPWTPDIPTPGQPELGNLNISTSNEGQPIKDILGTTKISSGNIIWHCCQRVEEVKEEPPGGKGGGSEEVVTGYKYYVSWALGLCMGPIDTLYTIYNRDDVVWCGKLDRPTNGGEETIVIPGMGSMTFYFGTDDQVANATIGSKLADSTLNTPYRHLCWAFFNDCCTGNRECIPTMKFVLQKSPVFAFNDNETIQTYDYNPAHAKYYILKTLLEIPVTYLDGADSFSNEADTLYAENHGISILFGSQTTALSYLQTILGHIDGIIRWGNDGKFHPKLLRADEAVVDLPSFDENQMLDTLAMERKSWYDTLNEVKVQYSERIFPADCCKCPDRCDGVGWDSEPCAMVSATTYTFYLTNPAWCKNTAECSDADIAWLDDGIAGGDAAKGTFGNLRYDDGKWYVDYTTGDFSIYTGDGPTFCDYTFCTFVELVLLSCSLVDGGWLGTFQIISNCEPPFSLQYCKDDDGHWTLEKEVDDYSFTSICKRYVCDATYFRASKCLFEDDNIVASCDPTGLLVVLDDCEQGSATYDGSLSWGASDDTIDPGGSAHLEVNWDSGEHGGNTLSWSVSGTGFTLAHASTTGNTNTLYADETACGSAVITVGDVCTEVTGYVRCTEGGWYDCVMTYGAESEDCGGNYTCNWNEWTAGLRFYAHCKPTGYIGGSFTCVNGRSGDFSYGTAGCCGGDHYGCFQNAFVQSWGC